MCVCVYVCVRVPCFPLKHSSTTWRTPPPTSAFPIILKRERNFASSMHSLHHRSNNLQCRGNGVGGGGEEGQEREFKKFQEREFKSSRVQARESSRERERERVQERERESSRERERVQESSSEGEFKRETRVSLA